MVAASAPVQGLECDGLTVELSLRGKTAIVTGGARGLGAAISRAFVQAGAAVRIVDVLDNEGRALAGELGGAASYSTLDVGSETSWAHLAADFPVLDILVNNAGVAGPGALAEQSVEQFRRVIDINLVGPWLGMRALAGALRESGSGVIINMSSIAGIVGQPDLGAYTASKWGLRGLTKTAALELGELGIRVCSIHPGGIRTPMTSHADDSFVNGLPISRWGEPEEIASTALFIAAGATYTTGTEFIVDGGVTAGPPRRR